MKSIAALFAWRRRLLPDLKGGRGGRVAAMPGLCEPKGQLVAAGGLVKVAKFQKAGIFETLKAGQFERLPWKRLSS